MIEVAVFRAITKASTLTRNYLVNFILKKYLSDKLFKGLKRKLGDKSWNFERSD
jgi:hypothetical protein